MSRESVRIAFLLASLYDLYIFKCDIGNAHLNSKCREKIWIEAGTELGTEKGTVMIMARKLYGFKRYSAAWRAKLAETLMSFGYKSCEADADIWMKRDFNPHGEPYCRYRLCYVDDLLHIGFKPMEYMDALNMIYWLKEGFETPDL